MYKLFLFFYSTLSVVICFNIDILNPIIYLDQTKYSSGASTQKSSYFGLSVILYSGDKDHAPWVQIGAPRGNSPHVRYENPGIIFRCDIFGPCKYFEIDLEYGKIYSNPDVYDNNLDNAWIGAAMDINSKSDRLVVCAPRWKNFLNQVDYRMVGACYWSHLNSSHFFKTLPLLKTDRGTYTVNNTRDTVYYYGQGEAGISVHLPENDNLVLMGAPGYFNWKGTIVGLKDKLNDDGSGILSRYSVLPEREITDGEIYRDPQIIDTRYTSSIYSFALFGYAITSGYFYSKDALCYVGGAPKSDNYKGQILVHNSAKKRDKNELDIKDSRVGTQFGEYFGASVAAGDINNDGLDDLFVGAPFRKNSKYNEGRMYLFLGDKNKLRVPEQGKYIDGAETNGQFGTSITFLGDMNYDGSGPNKPKYVAVSAPYEDTTGVVYIFKGTPLGLDPNPVQKIVGSSIEPSLRGFGWSISKPADIDNNGYKDIAIGAYKSGHVVLLRSTPLVSINSQFYYTPSAIAKSTTEFTITLSHQYYSFGGTPDFAILRTIEMNEDYRAFLKYPDQQTTRLVLYKGQTTFDNITIKLRDSLKNAYDPLNLKVTHTLLENKMSTGQTIIGKETTGANFFCPSCGVYDEASSTKTITKSIPFVLGCGSDNICTSELYFESHFKGVGVRNDTFILGATNVIDLQTEIENKGEKAYLLKIQVDLPKRLSFKLIPTLCEQNQTRITCPVANPLDKDEKQSYSLILDMDNINKRIVEDFLFINVTVLTNSVNVKPNAKSVRLNLKTEADISISGKSGEQSYSYGIENRSMVEFEQIYQVRKYGLSPVASINFEVFLPYAFKSSSDELVTFLSLYQPEGHMEGGESLIFDSEIPYVEQQSFGSTDMIQAEKTGEIRNRRDVENKIEFIQNMQAENADIELLGNKTFEISCNVSDFVCKRVYGKAGAFEGTRRSAVFQMKMLLNTAVLSRFLQKNTIIRYSSYGRVEIIDPPNLIQSDTRPDVTMVSSLFVNDLDKKTIDLWIIIVSAICGILLLLLLTYGLIKAGFFKRAKKEELEQLKAQQTMIDEAAGTSIKEVDDTHDE